ncbi:hypothetical protein ACVMB3_007249 [Sinorhizobium meliloti]
MDGAEADIEGWSAEYSDLAMTLCLTLRVSTGWRYARPKA